MKSIFTKKYSVLSFLLIIYIIVIFSSYSVYSNDSKKQNMKNKYKIIEGMGFCENILSNAKVTVYDFNGNKKTTTTDKNGFYSINVTELKEPLLIDIIEKGTTNCSDCSKPRGVSVTALISKISNGINIANANPLTDKIVSDTATKICTDTTKNTYLKGPQGLVDIGNTKLVDITKIDESTNEIKAIFRQTLKDAKVKNVDSFNPLTYKFNIIKINPTKKGISIFGKVKIKEDRFLKILSLIHHNRGYSSKTGEVGGTMLLDPLFRPISNLCPLNYKKALKDIKKIKDSSYKRIFIAGDSTASNYDKKVAPRKGWGQELQDKFKDDSKILVINAAQSGRSSRSFINEGWLDKIEKLMKSEDYLLVQFGHNDEKCGGKNVPRDQFDIENLGTYPNDSKGNIQGSEDISFQRNLEKHINVANKKNVQVILITPVTRVKEPLPITKSTHITSKGLYFGDYSQTVRDTAKANKVPLIDLDSKSIEFLNSLSGDTWKQYWLAVDPEKYPYYSGDKSGSINKPDKTHFQEKGAQKICDIIIEDLKNQLGNVFKEKKQ